MELFNKFNETIFLKSDSNLKRQINDLKQIRDNVNDKEKIDKDIKLLEFGLQGEKEIEFELKNSNLGMYVLHDITIGVDDLKAQIDYLIVTRGYIYLVECKNLIGNIIVDSSGQFKREYEYNGNEYKEAIYSPYTQAMRHKEILKKRWLSKNNPLTIMMHEKNFDNLWYKSLVVLSNPHSILNTKYAPKEIKDCTIRVDQLISYIKNDIEKYDKTLLNSKKDMYEIATRYLNENILEYTSISNKYKKEIESNKNLSDLLKQFRKEKSQKMNVPAYYIFNDNELDLIVKGMPKSIDELKSLNILSEIKIKLHGEEIINILNNN